MNPNGKVKRMDKEIEFLLLFVVQSPGNINQNDSQQMRREQKNYVKVRADPSCCYVQHHDRPCPARKCMISIRLSSCLSVLSQCC